MADSVTDHVNNSAAAGAAPPRTSDEIERVFGDQEPVPSPASARAEWSRYLAFLKQPRLVALDSEGQSWRAVFRMLGLDLAIMLVFIGTISAAAAMGFELPENVNNSLEPGLTAIALVVIAAPLLEELAFRSWLRGHPAIIAGVAMVVVGLGAIPAIGMTLFEGLAGQIMAIVGLGLALIGAPLAAWRLLNRETPDLFQRRFPFWFWLSTLAFALIHLGNYSDLSWSTLAILLPLILPQFALGTMLGYLRVHYGLAQAIALHAAHNAILFGLAMAGGLGGEAPGA
mgnify:FL=1